METNFFSEISKLLRTSGIKIVVAPTGPEQLLVTVLPFQEGTNDPAVNLIQPLNLRGSASVLDAGFFAAIEKPIQTSTALLSNMDAFNKSVEYANSKSKMEQERQSKEKRDKELRKKKYDEVMSKVNELAASEKHGQAIAQMPKPEDFPEQAEEIKQKMDELRAKHGQLSLL